MKRLVLSIFFVLFNSTWVMAQLPNSGGAQLFEGSALWCQYTNGTDAERGHPGYGMGDPDPVTNETQGHASYYARNILPNHDYYFLQFGSRQTTFLHLPFGKYLYPEPNDKMNAYGFLEAQDRGHTFWYDEYVGTYSPLVRRGHRVIFYNGAIHNTKKYKEDKAIAADLQDAGDFYNAAKHLHNMDRDVFNAHKFGLIPGCDLAIDNAAGLDRPKDSRAFLFMKAAQGYPVWVEAAPQRIDRDWEQLRELNVVMRWPFFWSRILNPNRSNNYVERFPAVNDQDYYEGDVMILVAYADAKVNGQFDFSRLETIVSDINAAGATPALTISLWKRVRQEYPAGPQN